MGAQELFDWLSGLAPGHPAAALCDVYTFTAAIALCAPSHQVGHTTDGMEDTQCMTIVRSSACAGACTEPEQPRSVWTLLGVLLSSWACCLQSEPSACLLPALRGLPGGLNCPASLLLPRPGGSLIRDVRQCPWLKSCPLRAQLVICKRLSCEPVAVKATWATARALGPGGADAP